MPTTTNATIGDYAFLSDCQTSALVGRDGTVEWWCPPRFDAPAVFARMLDPDGGHWTIQPRDFAVDTTTATRAYLEDTLVLRTEFETPQGRVAVTDALAFGFGERGHEIGLDAPHLLLRCVEGIAGIVTMAVTCTPRLDFARDDAPLIATESGAAVHGCAATLHFISPYPLEITGGQAIASFDLHAGETAMFALAFENAGEGSHVAPGALAHAPADWLADTVTGWRSWAKEHRDYQGPYVAAVRRSALVLQGLTYRPTGAIVAAATASLPETRGGSDNYDYRYVWVRDISLTIRALWIATCPDDVQQYFTWLRQSIGDIGAPEAQVQIMYGVRGERELTETTLDHLHGFAESVPVRIGNNAWRQRQNDVVGEIIDAVYLFRDRLDFANGITELVGTLADRAVADWRRADSGEWEARDRERPYLSGKLLCWVALDRAIQLAPRIGAEARVPGWTVARDAIRAAILAEAWSEKVGAYTGAFGSDELDASVLQMPLVGFLPISDPRMRATMDTIERELAADGLVHRWRGDGNGFLICTYWLVECLAAAGEQERAVALFERTTALANDLGLLAEEANAATGELWGNFPQAFSHVGLITAAWSLREPSEQTGAS